MTRRAELLNLLVMLLLALPGCGTDAAPAQNASQSPQADVARAAERADTPPPTAPFDPAGEWTGLLGCAGRDFPVTLAVDPDGNAKLTLSPALNRPNYPSPDGRRKIEQLPFAGTVHPAARIVELVEAEQPARPLTASLLVSPDGETALLRYGRCEYGLAERRGAAAIEAIAQELLIISERRVLAAAEPGAVCPANLEQWIAAGEALPLDGWARGDIDVLWEPELMIKVFGKPLDAIGAEERQQIRQTLLAQCGEPRSRRRRALIGRLAQITDYRSFRSSVTRRFRRPVAQGWLRYVEEALLPGRYAVDVSSAALISRVPARFQFQELVGADPGFDSASISRRLKPLVERARLTARTDDLIAALEDANTNFFRLTGIYARAASDQSLDQRRLLAAYAQHLPEAARNYAVAAEDARSAREMAGWLAGRTTLCPREAETACESAAEHFRDRLPALLKTLADDEAAEFTTGPETPEGLTARVSSDRQFAQRYRGLLEEGPLAALARERRRQRQRLQQRLKAELIEQIKAANSTVDLARLESDWFLDEDLDTAAARPILTASAQRRADQRPFTGPAGDYLNALYNQDVATLVRLDRQATRQVQPLLSVLAQQMDTMSVLGDGLLQLLGADSSSAPSSFGAVARELRSPSAIKAVAMRYLLDYEQVYDDCLGPDAREFVFSERVDTVTRSASGVELSRIEGITTRTRYRVKPQLGALFQQVFSRPSDASGDALFKALFGDDTLDRMLSGVGDSMRKRGCTDPEMLRLERGMISYLSNRQRYWNSGRSAG